MNVFCPEQDDGNHLWIDRTEAYLFDKNVTLLFTWLYSLDV